MANPPQLTKLFPAYITNYDPYSRDGVHDMPALLAFEYEHRDTEKAFNGIVHDVDEHTQKAKLEGYLYLKPWHRILFQLDKESRDALAISTHYVPTQDGKHICYFDLAIVDEYGDHKGYVTDPYQIEKAKSICVDLLLEKKLITSEFATKLKKEPCALAEAEARKLCGEHPQPSNKPPKAVLWLESSLTALHIQHMALLTQAMQKKGIDVAVLASEDTMKKFTEYGGKLTKDGHCARDSKIDFGTKVRFLAPLASQTTYNDRQDIVKTTDRALTPFEFIGSPKIREMRDKAITEAMDAEKPDMLVTSLWPSGYGPFTPEIKGMIQAAKKHNPGCKVYSLSNDIPYIDRWHNDYYTKSRDFKLIDRAFVRGDGTIPLNGNIDIPGDKLTYVGHFINPLPPRSKMPDKDRKVLVTYGTRESNWHGEHYELYFGSILDAAPKTVLKKQPWELIIGPDCPEHEFKNIKKLAKDIAERHNMRITVKQGRPDEAFRQETADAIFRIAQYDIFVLDDVSTGVPALITTGNIGRYTCGANDGDSRLYNLEEIGAPIIARPQTDLKYSGVYELIDEAYERRFNKKFKLPLDAPDKTASAMIQERELTVKMIRDFGLADTGKTPPGAPDPVVNAGATVTSQSPSKAQFRML